MGKFLLSLISHFLIFSFSYFWHMADLKMPNLNMKPEKFLFKKKSTLRKKTKKRLMNESFIMLFFSILLVYINYAIPNKNLLFSNFTPSLYKSFTLIIDLFSYIYQITLVIFILVSMSAALILLIGSFYRILKIIKRKKGKQFNWN